MVLPTAASGYPQYSGTPMIPPVFLERIMDNFYLEGVVPNITTTDYISEAKGLGDKVTFLKPPSVRVFDYSKGMTIPHEHLEVESVTIGLYRAKGWAIAIDMLDRDASRLWDRLLSSATDSAAKRIREVADREVMSYMAASVAPENQGTSAGALSGYFNLGAVGSPLAITQANILEVLTNVATVMDERGLPQEDRFIVMPLVAKPFVLNSELRNASFMGGNGRTILLNGKLPMQIAGLDIYLSPFVPAQQDGSVVAYSMVAGIRSATAFAFMLDRTRVKEPDDSWTVQYQGLMAYGYDVIRPEGLVKLYGYFTT